MTENRWQVKDHKNGSNTVFCGSELIAINVSDRDCMDYVWSEWNTEKYPIHIYDKYGKEIAW